MDTAAPDTLDAFLGMATYRSLVTKKPYLLAFTADFPRAWFCCWTYFLRSKTLYKHVGVPVRHAGFATILLAPPTGPSMWLRYAPNPSEAHAPHPIGAE